MQNTLLLKGADGTPEIQAMCTHGLQSKIKGAVQKPKFSDSNLPHPHLRLKVVKNQLVLATRKLIFSLYRPRGEYPKYLYTSRPIC